jgi:hypothetical protein
MVIEQVQGFVEQDVSESQARRPASKTRFSVQMGELRESKDIGKEQK